MLGATSAPAPGATSLVTFATAAIISLTRGIYVNQDLGLRPGACAGGSVHSGTSTTCTTSTTTTGQC